MKKFEFNTISIVEVVLIVLFSLAALSAWSSGINAMKLYYKVQSLAYAYNQGNYNALNTLSRDAIKLLGDTGTNDAFISYQGLSAVENQQYSQASMLYKQIEDMTDSSITAKIGRLVSELYLLDQEENKENQGSKLHIILHETNTLLRQYPNAFELYGLLGHIYYKQGMISLSNKKTLDAKDYIEKSITAFQTMENKVIEYHNTSQNQFMNHSLDMEIGTEELCIPSKESLVSLYIGRAYAEYAQLSFIDSNKNTQKANIIKNTTQYLQQALQYKKTDPRIIGNIHVAFCNLLCLYGLTPEEIANNRLLAQSFEQKSNFYKTSIKLINKTEESWGIEKNIHYFYYGLANSFEKNPSMGMQYINKIKVEERNNPSSQYAFLNLKTSERIQAINKNMREDTISADIIKALYLKSLLSDYQRLYDNLPENTTYNIQEFSIINNYFILQIADILRNQKDEVQGQEIRRALGNFQDKFSLFTDRAIYYNTATKEWIRPTNIAEHNINILRKLISKY
ncbi:MAG: hypothetical protein KBC30_03205 [Planctomycetes bacterium]|nr:hypothetical protein [Planctomycetota bacterium]